MDVRELRIGNLVKSGDFEVVVESIYDKSISYTNNWGDKSVSFDFEPIPLTEEWLLKFGFRGDSTDEGVKVGLSLFRESNSTKYISTLLKYINTASPITITFRNDSDCIYLDYNTKLSDCKHVHQLQNLYFALTGQELVFK